MNFPKMFKTLFLGADAADIPESKPLKVQGKGVKSVPPFLGNSKGSSISNSAVNTTNLVLSDSIRAEGTLGQTIKRLVLNSPDLSHAVETKIKTALSKNYTVIATDITGRVDTEGTELAQSFVQKLNYGSYDYTKFTRSTDLRSLSASLLYDSFRYGASCLEVVLGETRLPAYFKPIPARLIEWADDTPNSYPIYTGADTDVPLNFPTIIYSSTTQDGETPYSESPLQTAIQAAMWDFEFTQDLRRAATKNLLQRLKVTIKTEEYLKTLPLTVREDKDQLEAHINSTIADLESKLSDLDPEDSLVILDVLEADTISDANRSEDRSISILESLINGKIAAGAKILPAIIGRGESSNAASTESMLFLKAVASAQLELNILISRALTVAVRLFGLDVYVKFELEEVNLRPELELASFRSIKQATTLEQLSLGFITDEKASIELTGTLPPEGFTPLSGTGFQHNAADTTGNDYSNTSVDTSGKTDSTQAQKDEEL